MSVSEIVGEDVNLAQEPQEQEQAAPEQVTDSAPQEGETAPEQAEEPQVEEVRPKTVPLQALHEERQRRRELAAQLEQLRAQQAERDRIIEERLAALTQAQKPQPPAFEENPAEHLRHQLQTLAETQKQSAEQLQAIAQQRAAEQQRVALEQQITAAEAQFRQQKPDYLDAVKHLAQVRIRELRAFGAEEDAATRQAVQELQQHAYWCAANGKDPAAIAYELAMARGFRSQPAAPSAAEKLQVQQRGVQASKSLGSGGAVTGKPSIEALLSMSDEEFAAATQGGKWAKLMGG